MYYLRTRAAADAIKFTVDQLALAKNKAARVAAKASVTPAVAPLKVGPLTLGPCWTVSYPDPTPLKP